jgi:5-methylcytosine-specific restriction endonuclease McrA
MAKFTYEFVKEYFKKEGCKLLSKEYANYTTKLHYICQCGHEHFIRFAHFKKGKCRICPICQKKKDIKNLTHTYEYVKKFFKKNKCILLSKEYINNRIKLEYIAQCGHKHIITFKDFSRGHGRQCRECFKKSQNKHCLFSYDFVKKIFEDRGCILLDKNYPGGRKHKMNYIAQCGHRHQVTFNNFHRHNRGTVCPACAIKKNSGETYYNYKKDLTEKERIYRRHDKRNVEWRKKIFERDDYTCQITGKKGGDLVAHHLKLYSKHKELRFEIDNGVTLNKEFHKFVHKIFGKNHDVDIGELVEAQFLWDSGCR